MRYSGDRKDAHQGSNPRTASNHAGNRQGSDSRRYDRPNNVISEAKFGGDVTRDNNNNKRGNFGIKAVDETHFRPNLQNNPVARAKGALLQEALAVEEYGSVISLRPSFGFIQSIHSDEQVYFSEQDIYAGVKIGDHVSFTAQQSSKGLAASKIKLINDGVDIEPIATKILGTISRIPERHRSNCGLIEVELSSVASEHLSLLRRKPSNVIAYRPKDVDSAQLPRNVLLDRGDFVEFTLSKVPATNLLLATGIQLKQLKRDREREKAIQQQIQRMLDAGAVREIGVITAVKNKEYGFIKAQDRKDELYFRMDGFLGSDDSVIREGTEIEFFVVAEMVRGRISDRAMHMRVIPQGSVQFETVVARDALVMVVSEPTAQTQHAEETPGVGVLADPISVAHVTKKENEVIKDVEVWQRCLPDEMLCRRGDMLKVNVHYYRPEKLFFIRAVRLVEPFLLGRDKGTICAIKESAGFGFITSDSRKIDLYFRLNQVVSASGDMLKKNEVVEGLRVSFDAAIESDKLRACRVKVLPSATDKNADEDTHNDVPPSHIPIKADLFGKVVRSTTAKKESVGLIQVSPEVWKELQEFEYVDPDFQKSLTSFLSKVFLQEITIYAVSTAMRKQLCTLIDKDFLELMYEVVDGDVVDGVMQRHLRITKLYGGKRTAAPSQQANHKNGKDAIPKDGYTVPYLREDYTTEQYGPLGNDMEVLLDVVWDVVKNKRVARNVRLTDEPISGCDAEQVGTVDVLIDKGDKFGFIRCIPSLEKLFWHYSSLTERSQLSSLKQGSFVSFSLRRRGGMRCATQIRLLTDESDPLYQRVAQEEVVGSSQTSETGKEAILAVVVERNSAILLDVQQVASLRDKFFPLAKMVTLLSAENGDTQSKTWEKAVKVPPNAGKESTSAAIAAVNSSSEGAAAVAAASDSNEAHAAAVGPLSESGSMQRNRIEYAAKYFSHIDREPITIANAIPEDVVVVAAATGEESATPAAAAAAEVSAPLYKIGDIVEVSLAINWSRSQPISSLTVVSVVGSVLGGTVKRRGTLTKTKHRFKNMPHLSDFYHLNQVDFAEITELEEIPISEKDSAMAAAAPPPNASTTGNVVPTKQKINYYYCVQHDIRVTPAVGAAAAAAASSNAAAGPDSLAVGDEVEFCVTAAFPNIALYVRLIPRVTKDHDLNFQSNRQGINDRLKSKVGASVNVVSMAAGPPSDSAKGFESGWRKIDGAKLSSLPWASTLLSHLVAYSAEKVEAPLVLPPSPPAVGAEAESAAAADHSTAVAPSDTA